jgi:hypothetical protein
MRRQLTHLLLLFTAITAVVGSSMTSAVRRIRPTPDGHGRDRGAVSLEQVLWFVAAGVAVAVIAGIVWAKIRDQANTDPAVPGAP